MLHEGISHASLIKCLFQIEIVEYALSAGNDADLTLDNSEFEVLNRSVRLMSDSVADFIENESHRVANLKLNEFINKAKQKNWSFVYTQFSPSQYRYAHDKYEKFF